jgi:hypothetical protein
VAKKRAWVLVETKKKGKPLLSDSDKGAISAGFSDIIAFFKEKYIQKEPDKKWPYMVDIYARWHRNYMYLCQKYKAEFPERIADEFETRFVMLEFIESGKCNISYFRHTQKWHLIAQNITLEDCKKMIISEPYFHPIG